MKPFHDITDPTVAKALAHPLRTRLLVALEDRTASPSELAAELDVPLGVLSYHIRRLNALGFLKLVQRVPRRGAVEHYYTATVRPPLTDAAWKATPESVKDASIAGALDQVGSHVSAAASAGGFSAPEARLSEAGVTVDEQGWRELAAELASLSTRVQEIEAESRQRLADPAVRPIAGRDGNASGAEVAPSDAGATAATGRGAPREAKIVLMLYEDAPDTPPGPPWGQ
ncbi:MAG: winged helix-turn-helix domain-containing protein [Solirubrobacteraceae bacterium]